MNWWQRLRGDPVTARLAVPTDRPLLNDLVLHAARRFGPAATEEQVGLLSGGVSSLALGGSRPLGFLGLRVRAEAGSERWADLVMALVAAGYPPGPTLSRLLTATLPALQAQRASGIVCLAEPGWVQPALEACEFTEADRIITYARARRPAPPSAPAVAQLRRAGPADSDTILALNRAAFAPLWRYDSPTILSWLLTADHAVVAERAGEPVGFALTSLGLNDQYAQLVRIAIHPRVQGQGIGRQLTVDAIAYAAQAGTQTLTLNTQASNATSRRLYEALGFRVSGTIVSVLLHRLDGGLP
jgi:ribosomal-protein-alanine N-acetyltransferase